jgi:hypothetical protein
MRPSGELLTALGRANARTMAACEKLARLCRGHAAALLREIAAHRRELAIGVARVALSAGASVETARRLLLAQPPLTATSEDAAWLELGAAERALHRELRRALTLAGGVEPASGLLGIHYLRQELHHRELAGLRRPALTALEPAMPVLGCDA